MADRGEVRNKKKGKFKEKRKNPYKKGGKFRAKTEVTKQRGKWI